MVAVLALLMLLTSEEMLALKTLFLVLFLRLLMVVGIVRLVITILAKDRFMVKNCLLFLKI